MHTVQHTSLLHKAFPALLSEKSRITPLALLTDSTNLDIAASERKAWVASGAQEMTSDLVPGQMTALM